MAINCNLNAIFSYGAEISGTANHHHHKNAIGRTAGTHLDTN